MFEGAAVKVLQPTQLAFCNVSYATIKHKYEEGSCEFSGCPLSGE
jgi:hypothetical protein